MNKLLIKSMFIICIAVLLAMGSVAAYAEKDKGGMDLANPEPFDDILNDPYGTYEPSITADGKTMYFVQFPDLGQPGGFDGGNPNNMHRDMFVAYKNKGEWGPPERLPSPPNSDDDSLGEAFMQDTEPMISPDGNTLIFQSNRPGGMGSADLYVSRKNRQTGEWSEPESMGEPFNTQFMDHCLIMTTTTQGEVAYWASKRPDGYLGVINYGAGDIYASQRLPDGSWSPAWNLGPVVNANTPYVDAEGNDKVVTNQCRFVPGKGNLLGIATDHDGTHHQEYLVRYDPATEEWIGDQNGDRIFAGWNHGPEFSGASDGCGNFTTDGKKWIWSSGRNLGTDYNFPDKLDLFWIRTEAMLDFYEDETGLNVRGAGN